jgi:hypothetical protein
MNPSRGRVSCPVCCSAISQTISGHLRLPVNCSALIPDRRLAMKAPRGDLRLYLCSRCGMIFNACFDSRLLNYNSSYDNSLHFSPAFQKYLQVLIRRLIRTYDIRGKQIIEIGSGDGEFLDLLCSQGGNRGLGFDPGYDGTRVRPNGSVGFVRECYTGNQSGTRPDFICCRHVLEHVDNPREFLTNLRKGLNHRREVVLYFEMPNAASILRGPSQWDIIYPHVGYFSESSLRTLFEAAGFRVLATGTAFGDQFLYIEAAPGPTLAIHAVTEQNTALAQLATRFRGNFRRSVAGWSSLLRRASAQHRNIALWGAGSKSVTFLNVVPKADSIAVVVDLNPRKQGMYIPGTGQPIVAPEQLRRSCPDTVIVLNPVYEGEVTESLGRLDLAAPVLTAPPSVGSRDCASTGTGLR